MTTIESDMCAICHDSLSSNEENTLQNHTLQCEHCFHTSCIINWFRRGAQTCPSCRDPGITPEKLCIGGLTLRARASYLRRKIRGTRGGPPELRKLVYNIRNIENKMKLASTAYQKIKRDNKNIFDESYKLRRKKYKLYIKKREVERIIGLYENSTLQLPQLLIATQNPDDYNFGRRR
jgi:hypothetical protein